MSKHNSLLDRVPLCLIVKKDYRHISVSSMATEKILTFIKAIDKHFFNSFINDGQVCLNTVKWFRSYENQDPNVGDKFEGVEMACGKGFTLKIAKPIRSFSSEKELKNKMQSANWTELGKGFDLRFFHESKNANIFSLFAVNSGILNDQSGNYLVPQKFIDEFSNHRFVIFLQPDEFITKMNEAILKLGKSMKLGIVHYYSLDEKFHQNLSYFHKPDTYTYQSEFRIVFEDTNAVQQIFNLGSLNDLCLEIDIKRKYKIELIDDNQFSIKSID